MKNALATTLAALALAAVPAAAQDAWRADDPVLDAIWREGTDHSQLERLGQALMDSLGPRLTGSPGQAAAQRWAVAQYAQWGIAARNEEYGTWRGWRRGYTHVDLVSPRVRTLESQMLAWSPGTGAPVEGGVAVLPDAADADAFRAWLPSVRGRFVMISFPQPTCRPDDNWERWGVAADVEAMKQSRRAAQEAWTRRLEATGVTSRELPGVLEAAGAAGILTSTWATGWGVDRIFNARAERIPTVDLGCEDYGLVHRLAEAGDDPRLRVDTEAEFLGDVPVSNTVARIPGGAKADEYIMLSAHFDSWDGASGATDNGTGTVVMMEAMRILSRVYPHPRRTIVAGHWSGEEQGLNGSRAFAADHPEIVAGLHVLFNQDNGTGRVRYVPMQGFTGTAPYFRRWFARMPATVTDSVQVDDPGMPGGGGSDHASFVCHGAPAFMLGSLSWDYGAYTWHTNRDTYDKISWDDVRRNARMVAMLVYLADQEAERLPRDRRTEFPVDRRTGEPGRWPDCAAPARSLAESTR